MNQEIGTLQEKYSLEENEVFWEIPDVLPLRKMPLRAPVFKFHNIDWRLETIPSCDGDTHDITLHADIWPFLHRDMRWSDSILCTFGLQKIDGSMTDMYTIEHTFGNLNNLVSKKFLRVNALLEQESQLLPSNKLTIICKLKKLRTKPLELRELDTLSENIKELLGNEEFYDITVRMKDTEFKAHKCILAARSPTFAELLRREGQAFQNGIMDITDYDCDPEIFQQILKYIYSGKLADLSFDSAFNLYHASISFEVKELKKFCLEKMKEKMTVQKFFDFSDWYDGDIFDVAQDFFNRSYKEVIASDKWDDFLNYNDDEATRLLHEIEPLSGIVRENSDAAAVHISDSD